MVLQTDRNIDLELFSELYNYRELPCMGKIVLIVVVKLTESVDRDKINTCIVAVDANYKDVCVDILQIFYFWSCEKKQCI